MANSLLVLMPHEQTHGAFSILKQIGILSPERTKARAVKNVMKLIANSLSVAKVAPMEMVGEAGPNKPALLNRQRMWPQPKLHQGPKPCDAHRQLIIRFTVNLVGTAKPMMICA